MDKLINILKNILQENNYIKINEMIKEFQNFVWLNDDFNDNDIYADVFINLAYDLDYYESNSEFRKESSSYYGNERLRKEIVEALKKIEILKVK